MQREEDDDDLPLVDEINELLVKERTLMGLKVVEQHLEAQEWKHKYESLMTKISETTVTSSNIQAYEVVGDLTSTKKYNWKKDFDRLLHLQLSSVYPWCLDTSGLELHDVELKKLCRYPKSHSSDAITILQLCHSGIRDEDAELVISLLHFPRLQALDLSFNDLGPEFRSALIQTVEVKQIQF
jgi:hypothetical protein